MKKKNKEYVGRPKPDVFEKALPLVLIKFH